MCNYKSIGPSDRFPLLEILIHKAGWRNQERNAIEGISLLMCQGQTRIQGDLFISFFFFRFFSFSGLKKEVIVEIRS